MRFDIGTLDSGERSLPFGLLVFGTRRDQKFDFRLGGNQIDICTNFKWCFFFFFFLAKIGTSTKHGNIMLSKLGRQFMYYISEFVT